MIRSVNTRSAKSPVLGRKSEISWPKMSLLMFWYRAGYGRELESRLGMSASITAFESSIDFIS